VAGQITLTQAAQNVKITIQTDLQYDKPDKIYLRQTKQGGEPHQWLLVSDGKIFSYDKPAGILGPPRFREYVTEHNMHQDVRAIYTAADRSLGDRSCMLDIAIGKTDDLKAIVGQWATMKLVGNSKIDEQEVTEIDGDYRENSLSAITGRYQMFIGKDGDFVRYVLYQRFAVPDHADQVVDVTSTWDSSLKVDGPTNPELYAHVP